MPAAMAGAVIAGAEPRARSASTPARCRLSGPACATSGDRNWHCRDGSVRSRRKALAKAIRRSFGRHIPIQRCQIHKARNITERLSPALHASVRRALRQAWELDDAAKAEKLIRNLAQRLERDAPGVSKSILEGLDEILTVSRLGLPAELRRSLACTNIIENMMGTVRRVTRNVKRWSSSSMALRWTAAAMNEAKKGFRRLKAYKQLPALRVALAAHYEKETNNRALVQTAKAA